MTKKELEELMNGDGIILAYKEGDSIYPIFIDRGDADVLNLFIGGMGNELQVLKSRVNEYKRVKTDDVVIEEENNLNLEDC